MSTLRAILGVNRGSGAAVLRSDPRVMSWRETRSMGGCGEGAGVEETGWLFGPPRHSIAPVPRNAGFEARMCVIYVLRGRNRGELRVCGLWMRGMSAGASISGDRRLLRNASRVNGVRGRCGPPARVLRQLIDGELV